MQPLEDVIRLVRAISDGDQGCKATEYKQVFRLSCEAGAVAVFNLHHEALLLLYPLPCGINGCNSGCLTSVPLLMSSVK